MRDFSEKVFTIIRKIPKGKVLTYGQVATLAGVPRASRIVGGLLFQQGLEKRLPWQRVINAQGKLSTYRVGMGTEQKRLLQAEGIRFNRGGVIDLKQYQWWPSAKQMHHWEVSEETAFRISERLGF